MTVVEPPVCFAAGLHSAIYLTDPNPNPNPSPTFTNPPAQPESEAGSTQPLASPPAGVEHRLHERVLWLRSIRMSNAFETVWACCSLRLVIGSGLD